MEIEPRVINIKELAGIMGFSVDYLRLLKRKNPERMPPHTIYSDNKWFLPNVVEWLKENQNTKYKGGRKRKKTILVS